MIPAATARTDLDQTLTHLASESAVWVRAAAVVDETGALLARLVELTSGEAPPGWQRRLWEYPSASFLATVDTGETVVTWLRSGMPIGDRSVAVPALSDSLAWERLQSGGAGQLETLEWPSVEMRLSASYSTSAEPAGHLVSASALRPSSTTTRQPRTSSTWTGSRLRAPFRRASSFAIKTCALG